jgi:hypothetical protein
MATRSRKKRSKKKSSTKRQAVERKRRGNVGSQRGGWIYTDPREFGCAFFFFLIAAALCWFTESHYSNHDPRIDRWKSIQAQVVHQSVTEKPCYQRKSFRTRPFSVECRFQYEVAGKLQHGTWGPLCAVSHKEGEAILRERVQNKRIQIYVNPQSPSEHVVNLDGPWQLWLGRVFAFVFFLLSIPRVLIVPIRNLRYVLRENEGRKSMLNLIRSLFPVRYQAVFQKAVEHAYRIHPISYQQSRKRKAEVVHDPMYRPKMHEQEYYKKAALFDILWSFDSNPPRQRVSFFICTDEDFQKLMSSDWQGNFLEALRAELNKSSFPLFDAPVNVYVHSEEEIRRVGSRAYWF